jgi:hypothetical protein
MLKEMAKSSKFIDRPINSEINIAQFYREITQRCKKKHFRVLIIYCSFALTLSKRPNGSFNLFLVFFLVFWNSKQGERAEKGRRG